MLRAALIGLPATGKTTLFQLMTAVREAGRAAQGRGDVQIGVSKVPDPRLDHLTAMFQQIWFVFGSIVMIAVPVPFESVDGGGNSEALVK